MARKLGDAETRNQQILALIDSWGGPREVARQWASADRSAHFASTPAFVERYTGKWVAVWNCEVIVTTDSLDALREELDDHRIPPMEVYTAFVQPAPPAGTLIVTPFFF